MQNAVEQANAYALRMIERNGWGRAGTTLVAVVIAGATAFAVNLGDSPLFHYRRGELTRVSEDHSIAGALLHARRISAEEALSHPGRGKLEFFVGSKDLPREIPIRQIEIEPDDLLLLCSDGVSGALPEARIAAALKKLKKSQKSLDLTADELLDAALGAGETDNQTLILWRC